MASWRQLETRVVVFQYDVRQPPFILQFCLWKVLGHIMTGRSESASPHVHSPVVEESRESYESSGP